MEEIKAILFDFHGVLAYLKNFDLEKLLIFLGNFGLYFKTKEEKEFFAKKLLNIWGFTKNWFDFSQKILKAYIKKPVRSQISALAGFLEENIVFELYDDVKAVFGLPYKKAILSGNTRFLIADLNLEKFFRIFTPKETKFLKPDPRAFIAVLKKLKLKPEDVLMVGDEIDRDLIPAKKLGMKVALIDRKNKNRTLTIPKINSLEELKNFLA